MCRETAACLKKQTLLRNAGSLGWNSGQRVDLGSLIHTRNVGYKPIVRTVEPRMGLNFKIKGQAGISQEGMVGICAGTFWTLNCMFVTLEKVQSRWY